MENYFDKSLHYLGKNQKEVFVMNVGAMDGVLFDEMIGYTNMYNFKGLYVEPIPYLFEKLKNNIKVGLFENSAISDYNGEIEMMTIKRDAIDGGLVHNCFYGMSAVYPPKNGLGSEFDKPTVEKYGEIVKVNCITWERLLQKHNVENIDVIKIDAEGHDYKIFKQIDLQKNNLKVIRLEWINLSDEEKESIIESFEYNDFKFEISGQDIVGVNSKFYEELLNHHEPSVTMSKVTSNKNKVTLVTGLWNIKRDSLGEGWKRGFEEHYLPKFKQLLAVEENMIIFGDSELESFVFQHRNSNNTLFIKRDLNWFKGEFYELIQNIRTKESWLSQAGWLRESTQAKLEMYNPLVMSKVFLLNDAKILDKFDSDYMFWIDAGLTNTVHPGYFTHDKVLDKLPKLINKFSFVCFPYEAANEIHGFEYGKINQLTSSKVNKVARGGFFGGPKSLITDINVIYYNLLKSTLSEGYMGTEESIFTIMCYNNPDLVDYFEIESNGLLGRFFEDLKNDEAKVKNEKYGSLKNSLLDINKTALYVITFNSPKQFETLIKSFIQYDKDYLDKPKKFLLNNSSDLSTTDEYERLCGEYGFEHIKKDNLGICGGRQWIAEHFEKTDLDFYLFFEDDMFFFSKPEVCRNGFPRYVDNLYQKTLEIVKKENFDFIKLNYSEFYGDNGTQWSWYNVPQSVREMYWPGKNRLPNIGLDPNAPKTEFKNILSHRGVPYASGEIYYCNWPQIVSKVGNKKMFLDTTWAHPFEQTWMSHMYQLTKKGELNPGLLMMTPTEHDRFEHYDRGLRKES
jgi:FkbM family methyltransferase